MSWPKRDSPTEWIRNPPPGGGAGKAPAASSPVSIAEAEAIGSGRGCQKDGIESEEGRKEGRKEGREWCIIINPLAQ